MNLSCLRWPLCVLGLALLAAPAAHAFTLENSDNGVGNSDGSRSSITDPDSRFDNSGNGNGQSTIRQGNTTFRFGAQPSFDQRFSKEQMFEPNGRPLGER